MLNENGGLRGEGIDYVVFDEAAYYMGFIKQEPQPKKIYKKRTFVPNAYFSMKAYEEFKQYMDSKGIMYTTTEQPYELVVSWAEEVKEGGG